MIDNTIDFKEAKRKLFVIKMKKKAKAIGDFVYENKEVVLPIVIAGGTTLVKYVSKQTTIRKEENLKNLYCYDNSLGHYWRLRRELTNKEWVEIARRKENGEKLAFILDDMNVLKK